MKLPTDERFYELTAFMAVLAAICYLATIAAFLAWHKAYAEALGFGGLTTGLVGVIGTFKPRTQNSSPEQEKTTQDAIAKIPPATPDGSSPDGGDIGAPV